MWLTSRLLRLCASERRDAFMTGPGPVAQLRCATIVSKLDGAPHGTLLVVDATTGQNGVQQAKLFGETAGVTGVVLTKLDGSAKGGVAIPIAYELGLPVKLIGVGEQLDDLC